MAESLLQVDGMNDSSYEQPGTVEVVTGDGEAVVTVVVVVVAVVVVVVVEVVVVVDVDVVVVLVVDLALLLVPVDGLLAESDEPRRPFWNLSPVTLLM